DSYFHALRHHVSRRLAVAFPGADPGARGAQHRMAAPEDVPGGVELSLVSRDLSAVPLRPDHAPGLEGFHSRHARVDSRTRRVDADSALDLVGDLRMMKRVRDFFRTFLLLELVTGMFLTGRHLFHRKITVFFPEEKTPQSPRFRGLHA